MQDESEDGLISAGDSSEVDIIGEVCEDLQSGDIISFDVTSALEHDLFNPDQANFSGFFLRVGGSGIIEFYDHTDPEHGPRLSIIDTDSDGDDIPAIDDNCPSVYDPLQEDTYPPQGNGIGDACECEANFDDDDNVDGSDLALFKIDFGRNQYNQPCHSGDRCNGNFNCDDNVDGGDLAIFKEDYGRNQYNDPCPPSVTEPWCETYQ